MAAQKNNEQFDISKEMQDLYKTLLDRGMDTDRALTLVSLMPEHAILALGNTKTTAYLLPVAEKLLQAKTAAEDFDSLVSYMGLQEESQEEIADKEEVKQEEEKEEANKKIASGSKLKTLVFEPNTTSVLEVKDGKVLEDPVSKANMAFIRENLFNIPGENLPAAGEKGYYERRAAATSPYRFRFVLGSSIPAEQRVKDENGKDLVEYEGLVLAITGPDGAPIYVENSQGVRQQVHTFARNGNSLRRANRNAEKKSDKTIPNERIEAYELFLKNIQDALTKNSELQLLFKIESFTGGNAFFIGPNGEPTALSNIKNFSKEDLAKGLEERWVTDESVSEKAIPQFFFTVPTYSYAIPIERPAVSKSKLYGIIKDIATDPNLSAEQKEELLSDVVYTKGLLASENIDEALQKLPLQIPTGKDTVAVPTKTDEGYTTTQQSLADYVYENMQVRLDLRATGGELLSYSPVIRYTIPADIKEQYTRGYGKEEAAQKVEEEVTALKEGKKKVTIQEGVQDTADVIQFIKGQMFKERGISNEATAKQIAKAEEWYNNSPLAKLIPFNRMLHIVNSEALAEFTGYAINLYAGSNATDLYHEAWHGFSQLYLSKEEKIALYQEVKKLTGVKTFKEAEEFLAEDFRLFAMSGGKKSVVKGKVKQNIFQTIWNILKGWFGNKNYTELQQEFTSEEIIRSYYEKLFIGDISQYRPSFDNVLFTNLFKGSGIKVNIDSEIDSYLTPKESEEISSSIDGLFAEAIAQAGINAEVLAARTDVIPNLYKYARMRFVNRITEIEQELAATEDVVEQTLLLRRRDVLVKALTNFKQGELTAEDVANAEADGVIGYHQSRSKYIGNLNAAINALDSSYELDEQMNAMVRQDKSGNESSILELSSNIVLYSIRSLRDVYVEKGEIKSKLNEYGFPKLADFGVSFNRIAQALEGMSGPKDMHSRLNKLKATFPAVVDLLDQLGTYGDNSSLSRFNFETKLWQSFEKAMVPLNVILGEQFYATQEDEEGNSSVVFTGRIDLKPQEAGEDTRVLQTIANDFHNRRGVHSRITPAGKREVNLKTLLADSKFQTLNSNNIVEFLLELGVIPNSNSLFEAEITSEANVNAWNNVKKSLYKLSEITETLSSAQAIAKKRGDYSGNTGRLNQLIKIYAKSIGRDALGAQINANGDREYGKGLHNTATRIAQNLNAVQNLNDIKNNPSLKHLHPDNNPVMATHPWLKAMFDMTTGQRKVRKDNKGNVLGPVSIEAYQVNGFAISKVTDGVKEEPNGRKNMQMDDVTKFLSDIHFLFGQGLMEIPRASDKSTSLGFRLNVAHEGTSVSTFAKGSYFGPGAFATTSGLNQATDRLVDILAGEVLRMRKYSSDPKLNKLSTLNVEFTDVDGNKRKLISSEIESLVNDLVKGNQDPVQALQEIKEELSRNFNDYLRTEVRIIKDNLISPISKALGKSGVVLPQLNTEIRNNYTTETGLPWDNAGYASTIKSLIANNFFNNIYIIDLFAGGLHNYKSADDYTKRFAITSTGQVFRSDEAAVDMINARFGKPYAQALGVETKAYSPVLRTVVLKDIEVSAREEWLEANKEYLGEYGYAKYAGQINEADAQGYISFDTYRILSVLEGTWSDQQEALFQEFVKNPNAIVDQVAEYFPVRKFQYYGPLVNGQMQQALHKYSLMPMIPNVVRGRNLESLHKQMMENNIDYVLFESANKVAKVGDAVEVYEETEAGRTIKENLPLSENVNEVHTDYLKDQLFINSTFKGKNTRSTQLGKLLGNAVYERGVVTDPELAAALSEYEAALDALVQEEASKLQKELKTPKDLVNLFRRELDRRDIAQFKIDAIKEINGKLVYNLDGLPSAEELAKVASAIINKRLLRAKLSGEQLVQVASSGFEKTLTIEGEEIQKPGSVKYSNDLAFYGIRPDGTVGAAQVKIALQGEYKKLLLDTHPDGDAIRTLARLNEAIKDEKWLNANNRRMMISLTGVRIPVQGLNSMEFFEVAEFLPETAGNIIVVPSEITMKAGSDFDIDKLTLYMPSINSGLSLTQTKETLGDVTIEAGYISKAKLAKLAKANPVYAEDLTSTNVDSILDALFDNTANYKLTERDIEVVNLLKEAKLISKTSSNPTLADKGAKGIQNTLISSMKTILLSKKNLSKLLTPNDTNLVKDGSAAYKEAAAKAENKNKVSHPASYSYNLQKHQDNSIMKRALGIGAKGNTFNSLFQRLEGAMPDLLLVGNKGIPVLLSQIGLFDGPVYLGDLKTKDGQVKADLINQLINGWVDAGKDPWIANIKADDIIAPLLISMIDMGVSYNYAVRFLMHPAVSKYATLKRLQNSPVGGFYFTQTTEGIVADVPGFKDYGIFKQLLLGDSSQKITAKGLAFQAYSKLGGITEEASENIAMTLSSEKELKDFKSVVNISKTAPKVLSESELATASDQQILARLYLFIQATTDLKSLRLGLDLDTTKSNNLIQAAAVSDKADALIEAGSLSKLAKQLYEKSIIKTFKSVKDLQRNIFNTYFGIRSNEVFQKMLISKDADTRFSENRPYQESEEFIKRATNDFSLFLFQNSIHGIDIDKITAGSVDSYKGVPLKLQAFDQAAFGKDGIIYVNPTRILDEFIKRQQTPGKLIFKSTREFVSFKLETERLRMQPENEGMSEQELQLKAASSMYNSDILLGKSSIVKGIADTWIAIKDNSDNKEFLSQFKITDLIYKAVEGGSAFLKLKQRANTAEEQDALHEEILTLQNAVDFPEISKFFKELPLKMFYIHGMQSSMGTMNSILPQDSVAGILNEAVKVFNNLSESDQNQTVASYLRRFESEHNTQNNKIKEYYRNYILPTTATQNRIDAAKDAVDKIDSVLITDEEVVEYRKKCKG